MGKPTNSKVDGDTTQEVNMKLLEAAKQLDSEAVQSLLASGASAKFVHDPPGTWGASSTKSALHVAINSGYRDNWDRAWPIVQSLIAANADVNAQRHEYDWRGCGSSESAFEMVLPHAMTDVKVLETFLNAGADANTKSVRHRHSMRTDGTSIHYVLHTAVQGGDLEITRALLDAGAKVDAVASDIFDNERGFNEHKEETALHQACAIGNLAMVALLLARGANVDAIRVSLDREQLAVDSPTDDPRDPEFVCSVRCIQVKESPIHIAIRRKNANLLLMLVCAGADVCKPRVRGDVNISSVELCGGDEELLSALNAEWKPETHHLFPQEVQESVKTALLIAQRQKCPLPEAVLFQALALATGR
jgi:ankyrin repeat protein